MALPLPMHSNILWATRKQRLLDSPGHSYLTVQERIVGTSPQKMVLVFLEPYNPVHMHLNTWASSSP